MVYCFIFQVTKNVLVIFSTYILCTQDRRGLLKWVHLIEKKYGIPHYTLHRNLNKFFTKGNSLEERAQKAKLNYIEIDGNIGCIGQHKTIDRSQSMNYSLNFEFSKWSWFGDGLLFYFLFWFRFIFFRQRWIL